MAEFRPIGAAAASVVERLAQPSGVAKALAHHMARRAVEAELRAQGLRPVYVPYVQKLALMEAYKANHLPALLARAAEFVARDPKLRKMAEIEERERKRRSVSQSDLTKVGIEKTQLSSTTSAIFERS